MEKKFLKKIIAQSQEDLQIISACCADSKVKNSESILLYFEKPKRTYIFRFPVKYVEHYYENEENKEGNMRRVIKFRLKILTDS